MLNKLKYGSLIAAIIMILRVFLPDAEIPEGFQDAIMLIIVLVSQFFVRENEVTVNRLNLKKKRAPKYRKGFRSGPALIFLAFILNATPLKAQELEFKDALAVGGGSLFGEENQAFNTNTIFGAVHWRGLKLPMNSSTGIGIEISVKPSLEGERELVYTMWSLNRADIIGDFYAGTDMKILEEGAGNFDMRIVTGMLLGKINEGELALEVYSLEENRPISFAIFWRF